MAFRSQGFLLLKRGRPRPACCRWDALGLALQMEPMYAMATLDQVVGIGSYLAREHPDHLLTLTATLHSTLDHLREGRGAFPTELVGPVELTRTLANIYGARGLLSMHLAGSGPDGGGSGATGRGCHESGLGGRCAEPPALGDRAVVEGVDGYAGLPVDE
ncbi:MAG: hypothetical protein HZY76_09810 [Anaerolineae bacterium]|nr:MAG: hypothetical protein HZY76_09810 [Anaerolineae bacterium]